MEKPPQLETRKTAWESALVRARIENFLFHDLRHTFASHYVMWGGDIHALARILGHANPLITMQRYAHLSPKFIADQIKVMDRRVNVASPAGH